MYYTIEQVRRMVEENGHYSCFRNENDFQKSLTQFEDSFTGYLEAAMFCAQLVTIIYYEEGHMARDLALRYVALAAQCCPVEGLSELARISAEVTAVAPERLYYA